MGTQAPPGIHRELVARVLGTAGRAPQEWRRAAFENTASDDLDEPRMGPVRTVVDKVATDPTRVTDEDFVTMGEAGLTGDQMWELVICAAVGQSARQYEGALRALAAATEGNR